MKKIFFALCAVAALASCTNNELVELNKEAIAFQNAFVENGTKVTDNFTITKTNLESFSVWATTQHGTNAVVPILAEEAVSSTDNGATWGYTTKQYWIDGNAYKFVALKNYDAITTLTDGLPTEFSYTYNTTAPKDVVAAAASATGLASGNPAVSFTFDHLLAKAYFTLENTMTTNTVGNVYTYELTGVQITTPFSADCVFNGTKWVWENQGTPTTLSFGDTPEVGAAGNAVTSDTADTAHLLIPYNHTALAVAFTINTYYNGSLVNVQPYSNTIAKNIEQGNVYNFKLTLGAPGEEIKFSVDSVDEWVPAGGAL